MAVLEVEVRGKRGLKIRIVYEDPNDAEPVSKIKFTAIVREKEAGRLLLQIKMVGEDNLAIGMITELWVKPELRRKYIGIALVHQAVDVAVGLEDIFVVALTRREDDPDAKAFYQAASGTPNKNILEPGAVTFIWSFVQDQASH